MAENILVAVAWPYANGSLHLGQIAGAYLPPDIFARYHRARGNRVLMVSGSDQHGTPVTVRAEQEGVTPQEIVARYHPEFLECWRRLGITFDIFTTTGTDNHRKVAQDIFLRLLENGYIYRGTMPLFYDPVVNRFLPDRYVEGICPYCAYNGARGDQCDNCGRPLNADELIEPRSRLTGAVPEARDSEHFFLKLSVFNEPLRQWVSKQTHWRRHVLNFTLGLLNEGLPDRAITRDIDWGVPVPVPGFENKRIYVWVEALVGYLSASIEWAASIGQPDAWRDFWQSEDARSYYFIGKDNIVFHTIIWPAMLMGYGQGLRLPYDVPANQYLTIHGSKASTSRRLAVWLPDYLDRYDPDPLRFYLATTMPETSDSDFSWEDFIRRNNDELVATWGNLAHRVLTFTYRNFEGRVPQPSDLNEEGRQLRARAAETLDQVGESIAQCRFRQGISAAMSLAQDANRFVEDSAPWRLIREDRSACATALHTALYAISALKTCFYPYLPFTAQRLHEYLGFAGEVADAGWRIQEPQPGQPLLEPQPLFKKLDPAVVEEEEARLGL